jgi:hypothetical protein
MATKRSLQIFRTIGRSRLTGGRGLSAYFDPAGQSWADDASDGSARSGDAPAINAERRAVELQRKTTVLRSLSSTRRSECHLTARARAIASASRPTIVKARGS